MLRPIASGPNPLSDLCGNGCKHTCCACTRKQILATKGLDMSDFDSNEAAYKASETLIEEFYASHPEMLEKHPKKVYEGQPLLDQFWFADFKGIWGAGRVGGWGLMLKMFDFLFVLG